MKDLIRIMKALSDPGRVKIIKMLQQKELCVCEITAVLGLAQPTVSKHLKILEDSGLVEFSKDGSWVNYRLVENDAGEYAAAMLTHLREWLIDDKEIQNILTKVKKVDRCRIKAA